MFQGFVRWRHIGSRLQTVGVCRRLAGMAALFVMMVVSSGLSAQQPASSRPTTGPPAVPAASAPTVKQPTGDPAPGAPPATVMPVAPPMAAPTGEPAWASRKPPEVPTDMTGLKEIPYGLVETIYGEEAVKDPKSKVFVDLKNKLVIAEGRIVLREGPLEMFACPHKTKEHEAVVSIEGKASHVHTALLMVGAKPGTPVRFTPEYRAALGPMIEVWVEWSDRAGKKHLRPAQEWVKSTTDGKPLRYDWVFAGGRFVYDSVVDREFYSADGGDFICVSNFPSAALDLPIESTDASSGLLFVANTEKIPPLETSVRLILRQLDTPKPAPPKPTTPGAAAPKTPPVETPKPPATKPAG